MAPIAVGDAITKQLYLTALYFDRYLQRYVCVSVSGVHWIEELNSLLALRDNKTIKPLSC